MKKRLAGIIIEVEQQTQICCQQGAVWIGDLISEISETKVCVQILPDLARVRDMEPGKFQEITVIKMEGLIEKGQGYQQHCRTEQYQIPYYRFFNGLEDGSAWVLIDFLLNKTHKHYYDLYLTGCPPIAALSPRDCVFLLVNCKHV